MRDRTKKFLVVLAVLAVLAVWAWTWPDWFFMAILVWLVSCMFYFQWDNAQRPPFLPWLVKYLLTMGKQFGETFIPGWPRNGRFQRITLVHLVSLLMAALLLYLAFSSSSPFADGDC